MGKLYSIISALLMALWSPAAFGQTGYEWWLDNDPASRKSGTFSGDRIDLQVDMSGMPEGLHGFNCRINRADGTWGSIYRRMVLIPTSRTKSVAQTYEYWIDDDYTSKVSGSLSAGANAYTVDLQGLKEGLHSLNYRVRTQYDEWSSIYCQYFLIPESTPKTNAKAQSFEYWIDDDYTSKVSGSLSAGANAYTVDLQGLKEGLHRLNYRVRTQYDEWSSIYCQYFLIPESNPKTNAKAQSFEYWVDDDYASKVSGNLSSGANAYTIDLQGFKEGLHRLNYRVCTQYGDWSSIHCQYFYNVIESNEPRVVSYEYWLDNDRANRKTGTLDANQITLPIDISGLDKTSDFHLFNMRIGDNFKGWGSIYQKILVFNDHKDDKNIIGYRHRVNGIDLGFIEVNGGLTDSQTFMVDLPKDLKFETSYSGSPTFNGDKVSVEGSDSIHYSIQAKSKMGWSAPRIWDFALSHEFSITAVNMAVNSSRDFDVPESGTFVAVKFISTGVPLYFRANVPVALDVYRNGEKVREFSAEEIVGMVSVELEGGEYFGLLRDVAESDAKRFTFHLMDTPNAVPVPEITFEEGMVAITCSRADALIRYTLDGNDPDSESQLYEEPFEMKRNGTIKAKAWVEGSDIEPSAVAEYTVDTYKTAAPVAKFDLDARLLTLTSETKGATIRYTFEFDESDLNGGVWTDYEEPIQIRKNCTVYSRAEFEGYKDSDITVTEITSLASSVAAPEIQFADALVTISCANADAEIHYTIDDPNLTADSPIYTEPIRLERNSTIRAFALIPGLDIGPSDIVTRVIDSFKAATPNGSFNPELRTLELSCITEGAAVSYTFDLGVEWTPYSGPIAITKNCTVYAKASRDGWNDSEVAEIRITELADNVPAPEISFEDGLVSISCANADAEIHYTIDDPNLTAESPLYTGPFALDLNATIRAFAFIPGLDIEPSDIVTYVVDSYKVNKPEGTFNAATRELTITCATENARIFYAFDKPGDWTPYSDPISITKNCTVYAYAAFDGYNDSDVAEIAVTALANSVAAPAIDFTDGKVTITCSSKDSKIRYTIDDEDITVDSPEYTGAFAIDRNCTIRAFAFIPGLDIEPSGVTTKVIDSFKVKEPTGSFNVEARELTLSCETEDAKIFYSFDPDGDWTEYTAPISITKNRTVYAKATREGWNDSEVVPIRVTELAESVPVPEIIFNDGLVTISCDNDDAEIHYTIDDPNLTAESPLYTDPFSLDRNATIRAFALIPGLDIEPSEVTTEVIDYYKVTAPYGRFDSETRMLTILCDTEEAAIIYSYDRDGEWLPYSAPIAIEGNRTVYAKATRDGWNDSDVAPIVISDVKCDGVTFGDYDGRNVSLSTAENGATILYTTDGSEPSGANGQVYDGEFDAEGLRLIRAIAVKEDYMNSDESQLQITFYADEEHAETAAEGLLASAFGWNRELPAKVTDFRIAGRLNEADYAFIRTMGALRHLDLGSVADAHIPDNAFRDSGLISVSLPADLAECGDSILSGAPLLSSVIWNSRSMDVGEGLTGGLENPNVLLYVPAEVNVSGRTDLNIVMEGSEPGVTLHYGYPYYAAQDFRAGRVSLTHDFTQTTEVDVCRGWETIVLPFSPTEILHEVNGPSVPFAAWDENPEGDKPFWLYRANETGWEAAPSIEACVPYIISMPNNTDYVKEFNLGGKVTFSAEGVDLGPDRSLAEADSWINGTRFEGTFMPVEDNSVLSLNVGYTEGGLQPGSTFVPDGHTDPFGAFVSGGGRKAMPLFGDASSVDLPLTIDAGLLIETPAPGVLRICSGRERRIAVTTATGVTIRTLRLKPGEAVTLEGLTRDLYIVAGRKVMVR